MLYFTLSSIAIAISSIVYLYSSNINPGRLYIPETHKATAEVLGQADKKDLRASIVDRLTYESKSHSLCFRLHLSPEEYDKLRYFVPTSSVEQKQLVSLAERTRLCWTNTSESEPPLVGARGVNAQIPASPLDKENCLVAAIGQQANDEINSWKRQPKYNEYGEFYTCYGRIQPEVITYRNQDDSVPDPVEECLKRVLPESYDDVIIGKAEVSVDQQSQVDTCFGVERKPFNRSVNYKVSDKVFKCLGGNIGVDKLAGILSGSTASSDEEKLATECFLSLSKFQSFFLPTPLEKIPFIEEKSDILSVAETNQMKDGSIRIKGNALPGSKVVIYIFPDPVILITQADGKGSWVYILEQPLQEGEHVVYASSKAVGSSLTFRSEGYRFMSTRISPTNSNKQTSNPSKYEPRSLHQTAFIVIMIVLIILISTFIIFSLSH